MAIEKKIKRKLTGKLAVLNTLDGTRLHEIMMRVNNCKSGRCDICHFKVVMKCLNNLRRVIFIQARKSILEKDNKK